MQVVLGTYYVISTTVGTLGQLGLLTGEAKQRISNCLVLQSPSSRKIPPPGFTNSLGSSSRENCTLEILVSNTADSRCGEDHDPRHVRWDDMRRRRTKDLETQGTVLRHWAQPGLGMQCEVTRNLFTSTALS